MSPFASRPLNVAIIGGGLVGTAAAIALSKLPNIIITVYEKQPGPDELGEWIGLTESGMEVLDKLVDISEINEILYRGDYNASYISRHFKTGAIMGAASSSDKVRQDLRQGRTTRIPLHNVLLRHVPPGIIKYGYYLSRVEVKTSNVEIEFENNQKATADLLIAADGIYSRVRRQIYPESAPKYKGAVSYRAAFSESIVQDIVGLPNDTSCWHGKNGIFFGSRLGHGLYGVVAGIPETAELATKKKWKQAISEQDRERLNTHFQEWNPVVRELLKRVPNFKSYPLEHAPWLKSLVYKDRLVFVGDAAHPTSGAYGSGACFGFNDVWVLYQALRRSFNTTSAAGYDVHRTLQIFDGTRAPFLSRVEHQIGLDGEQLKYAWQASNYKELVKRLEEHDFFIQPSWIRNNSSSADLEQVVLNESNQVSVN